MITIAQSVPVGPIYCAAADCSSATVSVGMFAAIVVVGVILLVFALLNR